MTLPLLTIALEAAVPLWIEELKLRPLADVLSRAPDLAQHIAEHGDKILYRSKKKGESREAFNRLAEGIAALSFAPGGVEFAGLKFEATHPENTK